MMKKMQKLFLLVLTFVFLSLPEANIQAAERPCNEIRVIAEDQILSDEVIEQDVYIARNATLYTQGTTTFKGDIYIFGTLNNNGTLKFEKSLHCLKCSFASAGNYDYGFLINNGRMSGNNLVVMDDYLSFGIPAVTHTAGAWQIINNATCSSGGLRRLNCSACGEKIREEQIPATGHSYETIQQGATCTANGWKYRICTVCKEKTQEVIIPATGHQFSDWMITIAPTSEKEGQKQRRCLNCGMTETESLPTLPKPQTEKPVLKLNVKKLPLQIKKNFSGIKAIDILPGDKIVRWESSDKRIVKVSKTGKLFAKKVGKATITVTTEKGAKAKVKVNVQKTPVAAKKLLIDQKSVKLRLKKGEKTHQINVQLKPFTATEKVTYRSSKPSVATVSKKGKILARRTGKAKITVKCGKKTAMISVTVKK